MIKYLFIFTTSFVLTLLFGTFYIPFIKKANVKQNVSTYLNERHISKNGTLTMGGLIFIIPCLIICFLCLVFKVMDFNINVFLMLYIFILYSVLGFIDDYLKVKYHNNKGLSIILKLSIEIIISILFFFIFLVNGNDTVIDLLLFKIDLKFFYGFFILFLFVASSNAINITDGLDGLCAGLVICTLFFYLIISMHLPHVLGNHDISLFCMILIGSLSAFLYFNFYPAKIFMGDVGSLSLGGLLAFLAIVLDIEISLALIGIIYIIETISSFIQIIMIRYYKKSLFRKAPFHHHLEELGYDETSIVKLFYCINLIVVILGIFFYLWII